MSFFIPLALFINVACFVAGMIFAAPISVWLYKRNQPK